MKQEEQLLLKDLCARLPYGVKCYNKGTETIFILSDVSDTDSDFPTFDYGFADIDEIKPYLRPMSSMTEEEKGEFNSLINRVEERCINAYGKGGYTLAFIEVNDWLNEHHFDYRGLIEKGLATAVTEENNPYKE